MLKGYTDLKELTEDERIEEIGKAAMESGQLVGFVVDSRRVAKRYVAKLRKRFPKVRIIDVGNGPVANTTLVRAAGPLQS